MIGAAVPEIPKLWAAAEGAPESVVVAGEVVGELWISEGPSMLGGKSMSMPGMRGE